MCYWIEIELEYFVMISFEFGLSRDCLVCLWIRKTVLVIEPVHHVTPGSVTVSVDVTVTPDRHNKWVNQKLNVGNCLLLPSCVLLTGALSALATKRRQFTAQSCQNNGFYKKRSSNETKNQRFSSYLIPTTVSYALSRGLKDERQHVPIFPGHWVSLSRD